MLKGVTDFLFGTGAAESEKQCEEEPKLKTRVTEEDWIFVETQPEDKVDSLPPTVTFDTADNTAAMRETGNLGGAGSISSRSGGNNNSNNTNSKPDELEDMTVVQPHLDLVPVTKTCTWDAAIPSERSMLRHSDFIYIFSVCPSESWIVDPPACFTASQNASEESSSIFQTTMENLLIEHPSMSVYDSYTRSFNSDDDDDDENENGDDYDDGDDEHEDEDEEDKENNSSSMSSSGRVKDCSSKSRMVKSNSSKNKKHVASITTINIISGSPYNTNIPMLPLARSSAVHNTNNTNTNAGTTNTNIIITTTTTSGGSNNNNNNNNNNSNSSNSSSLANPRCQQQNLTNSQPLLIKMKTHRLMLQKQSYEQSHHNNKKHLNKNNKLLEYCHLGKRQRHRARHQCPSGRMNGRVGQRKAF